MNFRSFFTPLAFMPLATTAICALAQGQNAIPTATATAPSDREAAGAVAVAESAESEERTPVAPTRPLRPLKPFATVGGFALSGYVRSRVENWNFFEAANGDSDYTFTGHQLRLAGVKATPRFDVQLDLQQQLLTGLPGSAFFQANPTTQVPLGLGGNYFAANGHQDGALNLKQAFVRLKNIAGKGSAVRIGRFEFNDGTETTSKDPTLAFLKNQRISQRLLGTFGFSHTGRAFDGGQLTLPVAGGNFTLVGARPTEGVFQLEANDNIDAVNFLYGAYTRPLKNGEARLFGIAYEDGREASKALKVDNRPLAARQADNDEIRVYTLGANTIRSFDTSAGTFDVLAWGALQGGAWGTQDQSAYAFTLEAGYQPQNVDWKPWLRVGYYEASGDGDPTDGTHHTFFTPLPTPRLYARFPFYNQMNLKDTFGQLILRPNSKTNLRFEAHALRLDNPNDLFYSGGGAFQDSGFGFGGRPGGGASKIATVFDASLDYTFDAKTSVGFYFGRALGGSVIRNTFTQGDNANLAFFELTRNF